MPCCCGCCGIVSICDMEHRLGACKRKHKSPERTRMENLGECTAALNKPSARLIISQVHFYDTPPEWTGDFRESTASLNKPNKSMGVKFATHHRDPAWTRVENFGESTAALDKTSKSMGATNHLCEPEMMKPETSAWTRMEYQDDTAAAVNTADGYKLKNTDEKCVGEFVWKIQDIDEKVQQIQMGTTPAVCSVPFHTSEFGCKLFTRLGLSGHGSTTHLSLYIVMMKGEWTFLQKITMMLLDQDRNGSHLIRSFQPNSWPHGCPKFAPLSVLWRPCYVKNDTMYIKIIVDKRN